MLPTAHIQPALCSQPHPTKSCHPSNASCSKDCRICTEAQQLQSESAQTQYLLEELDNEHRLLWFDMNVQHDPFILKLPVEVASVIFEFSAPAPQFGVKGHGLNYPPAKKIVAPLVFGAVCRGWRNIAWSLPQLWTYLKVRLDTPHETELSIMSQWLQRSGQLPLSIDVSHKFDDDGSPLPPNAQDIIQVLNEHSKYWKQVSLNIPGTLMSNFTGSTHGTQPSALRSLVLHSELRIMPDFRGEFELTNSLPSPTTVSLHNRHLKSVHILWDTVLWADISVFQVDECFELLRRAKDLVHCYLYGVSIGDKQYFPSSIGDLCHSVLKDLSLHSRQPEDLVQICQNMTFPALESLSVDFEFEALPTTSIVSLLKRSSSKLKRLSISGARFSVGNIVSLAAELPSLECLSLRPHSHTDFVFEEFISMLGQSAYPNEDQSESSPFFPNLEIFLYYIPDDIDWHRVPQMFGPLSDIGNPRRRPLKMACFVYVDHIQELGEDAFRALLPVIEARLGLQIAATIDGEEHDLLKEAQEKYGP